VFAPEDYWRVFERTPVFISYGSHERIADEDRALVAAMRRDGVPVTAYEEPGGLHCGPIAPWSKPEAYLQFAKGVQGVLAEMGSR
jgi:acetyl esterase/lipase